jgi:hypothetical protein
MSRQDKNWFGLAVLLLVILAAFFLVNPLFRFSCSQVFLHDWLGVAHNGGPPMLFLADHSIARFVPLLIMFLIWGAVALWVYHDAERRNHSGLLWGLFVFIGNILGLIIYLIVRVSSSDTSTDLSAAAKCPNCAKPIQATYVACPHCGVNLAKKCAHCGKHAELDWKVCPYCGRAMNGVSTES